jgi:hypothetical protein
MSLHRCTETDCLFIGQTTTKGCGCHRTDEQVLRDALKHVSDCLKLELAGVLDGEPYEEELIGILGEEYGRQVIAARVRLAQADALIEQVPA